MKFKITLHNPDVLMDAVHTAVYDELKFSHPTLGPDELDQLADTRKEKTLGFCGKWFKDGAYLTVEIDTKAKTATVVPAK